MPKHRRMRNVHTVARLRWAVLVAVPVIATVTSLTYYVSRDFHRSSTDTHNVKSQSVGGSPSASPAGSALPTPATLAATTPSPTQVDLSWTTTQPRLPNVRFGVYRDGQQLGVTGQNSFDDSSVRPRMTYSYFVRAIDGAGRAGAGRSNVVTITTPAVATSAPPALSLQPPSSFPGPATTGYQNAPGYPGSLVNCDNYTIKAGSTYKYCDFPGGLTVTVPNVTFIGCRFASNNVQDNDVRVAADNTTFSYDTFAPSAASSPPVAYGKGYQYGIIETDAFHLEVDHANFWGFGDAMQISDPTGSSPANLLIVRDSWIHDPSADGGVYHVDGILSNDGGSGYLTFDHNTISAPGNTNGLAMQTSGGGSSGTPYEHLTITNNYFSGFGYTVNTGDDTGSQYIVFTGNVWGTDIQPVFGPLYGSAMYTTPGLHNTWSNNRIYVAPGTTWMNSGNNGLYWWPTDGNPDNASQIIGHRSDFVPPQ